MFDRMPPVHPGEILLEEFMNPLNLSQTRVALATGMPQSRIQAIISGRRGITADTALRLSMFFGNSPQFWLNCQNTYELDRAQFNGEEEKIRADVRPYNRGVCSMYIKSKNKN